MKKIIWMILGLFAYLFLFLNNASAAGSVIRIEGGGEVKQNDKFPINIFLNPNGNKVCALSFTLSYPADLVALEGTPTMGSDTIMSTEKNTTTAGTIYYQLGITGCATENLKLLTANFTAQKAGNGNLNFSSVKAYGGVDGSDVIKIENENGSFTITAPVSSDNTIATPEVSNPTSESTTNTAPPVSTQPKSNVSQEKVDNRTNNVFIWMISSIILLEIVLLFIYALRRKKAQNLNH